MRKHPHPLIEPLEARIAPASIILSGTSSSPLHFSDKSSQINAKTHLPDLEFVNAADGVFNSGKFTGFPTASDAVIAKTLGNNPKVWFIEVSTGEDVRIQTPVGNDDLVNVANGNVVAFFTAPHAANPNDQVTDSADPAVSHTAQLTGIALGNNVSVAIGAGVYGDIVTNFNDKTGMLGGSTSVAHATAPQLLPNVVTSLNIAGPVTRAVIAGGSVGSLVATGIVNDIFTGTAANGYTYDFATGSGTSTLAVTVPKAGVAGPSLSGVVITGANSIRLGTGGAGAAGGSLSGLTLLDDTAAISVLAGTGGTGAPGHAHGGAGGSISNILVESPGFIPPGTAPNQLFSLTGGTGGAGLGAPGGAGGAIANVFVDYTAQSILDPGTLYLNDNVTVRGGAGGTGAAGGAGGSLANINILTETYHKGTTPEYQLLGGAGGEARVGGIGGTGGSVTSAFIENHLLPTVIGNVANDSAANSPTKTVALIAGGAAGLSVAGPGGTGGSVSSVKFEGYNLEVLGGAGENGHTRGGAGGSVTTVNVLGSAGDLPGDDFHDESLVVGGGNGGSGKLAAGGAGGLVAGVTVDNADFGSTHLDVATGAQMTNGLQIAGGNGGSGKTAGGPGGAISTLTINSQDFYTTTYPSGLTGEVNVASGSGGSASGIGGRGGVGGAMTNATILATKVISSNIATGSGGNGGNVKAGGGFGGAGGLMTNVALRTSETPFGGARFAGGSGGTGGLIGSGGAGGGIVGSSADVPGAVSITGGNGGAAGARAAAGAGGTLNGDGAASLNSSGFLIAGSAGSTGGRAGAGGSNIGANVQAATDVEIIAGNGTAGGIGGSVTSAGFSGAPPSGSGLSLVPPTGNISVKAGNGGDSSSTLSGAGGAGGTINTLTGFVSSGDGFDAYTTKFVAGQGGSSKTAFSGGAGGSVDNVRIFGGGGADVTFFISAGDAGNSPLARSGAAGGSVNGLAAGAYSGSSDTADFSISQATNFNYLSAGNGGTAKTYGGTGGSVSNIHTNAAIGVRSGKAFGFNLTGAGGISAGAAGGGTHPGTAGNVTNISADAIASIVAGHLSAGQGLAIGNLANQVSGIVLNGFNAPSLVQPLTFTYGGDTTVTLDTRASITQVANALNALASIKAAGGVTVTAGTHGYVITFNKAGANNGLIAQEPAVDADGTTDITQEGNFTQEQQNLNVYVGPFALTYGGQVTYLLPANAQPYQVENALNALPAISALGGVFVGQAVGSAGSSYQISFADFGTSAAAITPIFYPYSKEVQMGSSTSKETQNVQLPPFQVPQGFSLAFDGEMTGQLGHNATAAQVAAALNKLPAIVSAGGVTVIESAGTSTSDQNYTISFNKTGLQPIIYPNFAAIDRQTTGNANTAQTDTLSLPLRGDFQVGAFAETNFVGSIENILRPNAANFQFTANGKPTTEPATRFQFGDSPIDGLIAALNLTAYKNFVPEAYVTAVSGNALLIDDVNS